MAFKDSRTNLFTSSASSVTQLSPAQREQATQGGQLTAVIQNLYSLVLYDTVLDKTHAVAGSLDPGGRTKNAEYFFRVPPKVHEFDEPFATTITNTQYGGKYVESYGSVMKSVRISGTTGVRPNKITSPHLLSSLSTTLGVQVTGITESQIKAVMGGNLDTNLRTLPSKECTGHDDIIFLRNIFREYSDIKSNSELAGRVVMLWRNLKDADYWVVEPEDFKLSQSSGSPLSYDYAILLKTLSKFDFTYTYAVDPLEQSRRTARFFARVQEYGQNLTNIFLTLSNDILKIGGYASFIKSTVLSPLLGVINGLASVVNSSNTVFHHLRTELMSIDDNIFAALKTLSNAFGQGAARTKDQQAIIRALLRAQITVAQALVDNRIRRSSDNAVADLVATLNRRARAYETPATATTPGRAPAHSPSYIGAETAPSSVRSDLVRPGEDLRDIADRTLGDRSRWRLLATMNSLRQPYISLTGGAGVLRPGDIILLPGTGVIPTGVVGSASTSSDETNGTPQANSVNELAYGRDLRLLSTFSGTAELTDLVINQRGDLGSIQGVPNVEQAVRIKFSTERGELPAHPKFGAKFAIGRKATPASFAELRINTIATILSDTRVEEVRDLKFLANGDVLAVSSDIVLKNSQDSMSTSFSLRRF